MNKVEVEVKYVNGSSGHEEGFVREVELLGRSFMKEKLPLPLQTLSHTFCFETVTTCLLWTLFHTKHHSFLFLPSLPFLFHQLTLWKIHVPAWNSFSPILHFCFILFPFILWVKKPKEERSLYESSAWNPFFVVYLEEELGRGERRRLPHPLALFSQLLHLLFLFLLYFWCQFIACRVFFVHILQHSLFIIFLEIRKRRKRKSLERTWEERKGRKWRRGNCLSGRKGKEGREEKGER